MAKLKHSKLIGSMFILLGLAGVGLSIYLRFHNPEIPKAKNVSVTPAPSAAKPSPKTIAAYNVPPNQPKYLSIPTLKIDKARVIKLGIGKDGSIATPGNIFDAGWYSGSSQPGESGAMFIYGHVSSWQANGLFYNLKKLKADDTVTVTRGDNTTFIYKVVSIKVYDYNQVDMNQVLSPVDPSKPGLNLMTCTGHVIKGTSQFDERLVVFTSQIN